VFNRRPVGGEPVADLEVHHAPLVAATVDADEVPSLVDELPLLAVAATFARGTTEVRGAEELRHKETDRVAAVVEELRRLGVRTEARTDGFTVLGVPSRPRGGRLDARGDHRMAMLGAVAGLASREGVEIEGAESVAISFPGFFDVLESVAHR
jgi:3-phosphoshikimate 1-carboxyvinyltransferase